MREVTLAVPGGLAGQIFAVGYAAWVGSNNGMGVHVRFHDMGTSISKLGVSQLFETETAKSLGLSYSNVSGGWSEAGRGGLLGRPKQIIADAATGLPAVALAGRVFRAVRLELNRSDGVRFPKSTGTSYRITMEDLASARPGSVIAGYPTDYQVVEDAWPVLSAILAEAGFALPNSSPLTDTVAIHWRLGDYVNNLYHGAVSWASIENCLRYANPEKFPLRLFTDSPDLALEIINAGENPYEIELISQDIWGDLEQMMRSKTFIGTHSGVSFLAALALGHHEKGANTWLPSKWFHDPGAQASFSPPAITFGRSALYPAKLVTEGAPF